MASSFPVSLGLLLLILIFLPCEISCLTMDGLVTFCKVTVIFQLAMCVGLCWKKGFEATGCMRAYILKMDRTGKFPQED